jgi:hypothetical protein
MVLVNLTFLSIQLVAQERNSEVELNLTNLYYGNENEVLIKLFWLNPDETIGIRYRNNISKDLVLLNHQRLITDSLSINKLFLEGYSSASKNYVGINGFIQLDDHQVVVLHGWGNTQIRVKDDRFELIEKNLPRRKPNISPSYFEGYELVYLSDFTIGYHVETKTWTTDADFWVYNWNTGKVALYEDSKYEELTKNRYWDMKRSPEPYDTYSHFLYNIVQTKEGFLFNLPLKNRFALYNAETNEMQGYTFPELKKNGQAWFAFYDRSLDRFFAALDSKNGYEIHGMNSKDNSFYYLTTAKEQPLGVMEGKVYIREITFTERKKGYFYDHYLVNLYPRLE